MVITYKFHLFLKELGKLICIQQRQLKCYVISHLTNTLRAPRGVTRVAGAKAYAAKLASSPTITIMKRHKN